MRIVRAAIVLCFATGRVTAQPAEETIVLAGSDAVFQAALDEALAPAGMGVVRARDVTAPSIGALSTASRELADRLHATATVWLIGSGTNITLVTYDRERDRLLIRELAFHEPLSPTQAAEAARIARTMLRALRTSPDIDQLPPRVEDAPKIRENIASPEARRLAVGALVGGRFGAPDSDLVGQLAVAWRPDQLGAEVSGELAPSADVTSKAFNGTVIDVAVAAVARMPFELIPRFRVTPSAGLALHTVRLRGALSTEQPIHDRQLDLAGRVGGSATYRVGHDLDVGIAATLDLLLDRQRYQAGDSQVLLIPRVQAMFGAFVLFRVL